MIPTDLKTSEVLDLAADAIEQNGWRTGGGWWPSVVGPPGLCLEGGLIAALGLTQEELDIDDEDQWGDFQSCPAYRAVGNYIGIGTSRALWSWNDNGQTQDSVLEALRGAAEAERQKEQQ